MIPATDSEGEAPKQLSNLIAMDSPKAVLEEVSYILSLIETDFDTYPVVSAFHTIYDLFTGQYPGYRACNTEYHDFQHTSHVFIATARLIHGAWIDGERFDRRDITLGLMASLFHDSGYIQDVSDTDGTGAKHTAIHVERGMELFENYGRQIGLDEAANVGVQTIILCTNLSVDINTIQFPRPCLRLLGNILGTADVLAQMADRNYLEKLLFLYNEIRESGIGGYSSEVDLLEKTIVFYDFIANRLQTSLQGVDRYMRIHFIDRWNIHTDLYQASIEKQRHYLSDILARTDSDLLSHLKRGGIVDKFNRKYRSST